MHTIPSIPIADTSNQRQQIHRRSNFHETISSLSVKAGKYIVPRVFDILSLRNVTNHQRQCEVHSGGSCSRSHVPTRGRNSSRSGERWSGHHVLIRRLRARALSTARPGGTHRSRRRPAGRPRSSCRGRRCRPRGRGSTWVPRRRSRSLSSWLARSRY